MDNPDLNELNGETVIVGSPSSLPASFETTASELTVSAPPLAVFGALGDLARKAIFPNLFVLWKAGLLPSPTHILGCDTRLDPTGSLFQAQLFSYAGEEEGLEGKRETFQRNVCSYVQGAYGTEAAYDVLEREIEKLTAGKEANRVFFLAIPPSSFALTSQHIKKHNFQSGRENRLVVEKPLGHDSESSKVLLEGLREGWSEEELYLVDHLLGEDFCFEILRLRFGNAWVTDEMLSAKNVKSIVVLCEEPYGAEGRGGYFDEYGIIRDMCQNHLLQALTFLTMESPSSLHGDHLRDAKVDLLKCIPPILPSECLLGQYIASSTNPSLRAYTDDPTVLNKQSKAETFAEFVIWINNDRWKGVPVVFKCGKAIAHGSMSFTYNFLPPPSTSLFPSTSPNSPSTSLSFELHPSRTLRLSTNFLATNPACSPTPAPSPTITPTVAETEYPPIYLAWSKPSEAAGKRGFKVYEGILLAVLKGDKSVFVREDELVEAWRVFSPLLHWKDGSSGPIPAPYEYGTKGPEGIEAFEGRFL